jgi:hypothetical protein
MLTSFPDGAFTVQSLEHVARSFRREPSYAELCETLGAWWKDHRPPSPALQLEGPDGPAETLDEETMAHVSAWLRRRAMKHPQDAMTTKGAEWALRTYHDKWPKAFAWIVEHDVEAASIAVRRRWTQFENTRSSWQDGEKVLASVRLVHQSRAEHQLRLGSLLGRLVAMHAPNNLSCVPNEWHPSETSQ